MRDSLRFFAMWLRRPGRVGAVVPSGKSLATAMAKEIDPSSPGAVVELGGGTGNITSALLANRVDPYDIVVIEQEPRLAAVIAARFPSIQVICGDARKLDTLLARAKVSRVRAVVSGLPLLSMSEKACRDVIAQSFGVLSKDGVFVQFTYGPAAPISPTRARHFGVIGHRANWVLDNLPPACVWSYRRRSEPAVLWGRQFHHVETQV